MVDETVKRLGGLHVGINNAGINKNNAAEDTPEEEWVQTFDINTKGALAAACRHTRCDVKPMDC